MNLNCSEQLKEMAREVLMESVKPYTQEQLAEIPRIHNLKNRYFLGIDNQEWDIFEDVFVKEGFSAVWQGRPGAQDPISQVKQNEMVCGDDMVPMHMGHNIIVQFTGDKSARVLTRLNDYHTYKDDNSTYEGFGFYVDDVVLCDDNVWRIKTVRLDYRVILGGLRTKGK